MDIDKIILYVIIGALILGALVYAIIWIIKFCKMSKDEKIKLLKTYLKGLIALAEQELVGSKRGEEKLAMVEEYFNKKAPVLYKMVLSALGKENLKDLIEEALKEIKDSFGGC